MNKSLVYHPESSLPMNHPEWIKWIKQILLHSLSTVSTIIYLEMAPDKLVISGIFVAYDCLTNEVKQIDE